MTARTIGYGRVSTVVDRRPLQAYLELSARSAGGVSARQ